MWEYKNKIVTDDMIEGYVGYVYQITNLLTNQKYIGKKLFKFSKTKSVKGKRKKVKVESDWRDYFGSNKTLKEDVGILGAENFKREILRFCRTKGECNYYEMKYQIEYEVLENSDWYNDYIGGRIHRSHIPSDDEKS